MSFDSKSLGYMLILDGESISATPSFNRLSSYVASLTVALRYEERMYNDVQEVDKTIRDENVDKIKEKVIEFLTQELGEEEVEKRKQEIGEILYTQECKPIVSGKAGSVKKKAPLPAGRGDKMGRPAMPAPFQLPR